MLHLAAVLVLLAPAQAQEDWKDTHRIVLRNGNSLDGQLGEVGADYVILKYQSGVEVTVKKLDIERIEVVRPRHANTPAPVVPKETEPKGTEPGKTEPRPEPPPPKEPVSPEVKAKTDALLDELKKSEDKQPAIEQLSKAGAAVLVCAADRLDELDADAASWVLAAVERAKEKKCIPGLRRALARKDAPAIVAVVNALKFLEAREAVGDVKPLLKHAQADVRAAAVEMIGAAGPREAMELILPAIVDPDRNLRQIACGAIIPMAKRLKMERDTYFALRNVIPRAKPGDREMVAMAIGQLGVEEGASTLLDLTSSDSRDVRGAAVAGLAALSAKSAVPRFITMLETEKDDWVRQGLVDTLGQLGDTSATVPLINQLQNEKDLQTRNGISRALHAITGQNFGASYDDWKKWLDSLRDH